MTDEPLTRGARDRTADDIARATAMVGHRLDGYLTQWEEISAKLRRSEYHADDLVEDCFRFWGNSLRDAWAVTAVITRAAAISSDARSRSR